MQLQTIRQVSKQFNISTRTLRYYEQIGLILPVKEDSAPCRRYDSDAIMRLGQVIVLRKLRIPLGQIGEILRSDSTRVAIQVFQNSLSELEEEITALSTIRSILGVLMEKLNLNDSKFTLPDDENLLEIVDSLTVSRHNLKEEKNMGDLNQANERLNKLTDRDVRILCLPPATVAAYQYIGDDPETHCHAVMDKFVRDTDLVHSKPDVRHFGFNAPNPVDETGFHGYEVWVTIPDTMEVPAPIVKKQMGGGLYAAHMIPFGAFEEWGMLCEWVQNNPKYQGNSGDKGGECMWGLLEEHLNFANHISLENTEPEGMQLDLLHPIKERQR